MLHIVNSSAGASGASAAANANDLVLDRNGSGGMTIFSSDAGLSNFVMGSPSATSASILRYDYTNNQMSLGTNRVGGALIFKTNNWGERMRIDSSGDIGIGTTTPGYKLDVQGGDINASGSVRAAGVALTSDIRYKRDIEPLENALEKILNIRGVSYNWRTEEFPQKHFNDRHQVGVIAQEVEQQFPEVVDTNKEGYKSVNYPALVAPLIEAVKTLYNRLIGVEVTQVNQAREIASKTDKVETDALRAEVKAKDQKIKELEKRLERIEKFLKSK